MTHEKFDEFLSASGLKQKAIAKATNIPEWVFSLWHRQKNDLYPMQHKRLDEFCETFSRVNDYMKVQG